MFALIFNSIRVLTSGETKAVISSLKIVTNACFQTDRWVKVRVYLFFRKEEKRGSEIAEIPKHKGTSRAFTQLY